MLQFHYCTNGFSHGISHLGDGILLFPALLSLPTCEVRDVKGGEMLRIGRSMNIRVGVIVHQVYHVTADVDEIRDDSIVHYHVSAEGKWVVVDRRHRRGRSSTNVGENSFTRSVRADASKIGIMQRWLSIFVEGGVLCSNAIIVEFCRCRRVPCHSKTIDIEEAVASCDLVLCGDLVWIVGY